ncbi:MAG: cupin domain-containing protein [Methylacidiphilaceae bacterium]|nr:cupin domain-containing protein [Candidatus Methylacidiphilaceae bacterium]
MNAELHLELLGEDILEKDAALFEYSKAADPIGSGATPQLPVRQFLPDLYASGETRLVPLDLSRELKTVYPATSPSLLAQFMNLRRGDSLRSSPQATSELFYVVGGSGYTETEWGALAWRQGDIFVLPGVEALHRAEQDTLFYAVNDSPLLSYLGVSKKESQFAPFLFRSETIRKAVEKVKAEPEAGTRSRVSILLANRKFCQTMTATHSLWAMFGIIVPGSRQKPHRHQSVALDFVVEGRPGVYTRVGRELGADGSIRDATRIDWISGSAFVTPSGYWHEHVNESDEEAYILPIQDAGLHTYLRTLDIRFT